MGAIPRKILFVMAMRLLAAIVLLLLLAGGQRHAQAAATIIYVNDAAPIPGTGGDWQHAYPKLQDALAVATAGTQIWVAKGLYYPDEAGGADNNLKTASFVLKNGVALYGGFAGTEKTLGQRNPATNLTFLSGDLTQDDITDGTHIVTGPGDYRGTNALHVVFASNTDKSARLDGFVVTGGVTLDDSVFCPGGCGGGLFSQNGSPTLANLTVTGNRAWYGAGLYFALTSTPTLTDLTVSRNFSDGFGGGLTAQDGANCTLTRVHFTENSAAVGGGGAYVSNTNGAFQDVTFSNNQAIGTLDALGSGGGLYIVHAGPTLTNVTLTANEAPGSGGGIYLDSSNSILTNVTITANRASAGVGGGLTVSSGNPQLSHVTFEGNSADFSGGGMYSDHSTMTLLNVNFIGNRATNGYGGGISDHADTLTLRNVNFTGNRAGTGNGGGMYNDSGTLEMINVLFSGNAAPYTEDEQYGLGGGLFNYGSTPTLTNVTLSGNQAQLGSAIYNVSSSPVLQNSIIWGYYLNEVTNDENSSMIYRYSAVKELNPPGPHNLDGTKVENIAAFVRYVDCGLDGCTDNPATNDVDESANDDYGDLHLQSYSTYLDVGNNNADLDDTGSGTSTMANVESDLAGQPRIVAAKLLPATVDLGVYERAVTPPHADAGGPYHAAEGSSVALIGSASTDDTGIKSYAWDCTNNGSVDATAAAPTGSKCTYGNDGKYTLGLTVSDGAGATNKDTASVTIDNVSPVYQQGADQSTTATSAQSFLLGSFTDPGAEGSWPVTVNWGDGSPALQFNASAAGILPNKAHTYAHAGTFNVVVIIHDDDASDTGNFQVVVNAPPNGAPAVTPPADQAAAAGVDQSFKLGSFTDSGSAGPWQISVNWGDGSTPSQFGAGAGGVIVAKPHTYAAAGDYEVVVSVSDGALTGSATFRIAVTAQSQSGSITGLVFDDKNSDGDQAQGEAGVATVAVTLSSAAQAEAATVELTRSTTTDANGAYRFDNVPAGDYTIKLTPPEAYQLISSNVISVHVNSGKTTTAPVTTVKAKAPDGHEDGNAIFLPKLQK